MPQSFRIIARRPKLIRRSKYLIPEVAMISQLTCPVCRQKVILEETNAMPFCSERCRSIDLGRWLEEEIGVPVEPGTAQGQLEEHREVKQESEN